MKLTTETEALLRELLAWDRARVDQSERRGHDVTIYRQRQDAAELALSMPPATWPGPVRELFQAVLEVTRGGGQAKAYGIRRLVRVPALGQGRSAAFRRAAREIGVLDRLVEVAPRHWSEEG